MNAREVRATRPIKGVCAIPLFPQADELKPEPLAIFTIDYVGAPNGFSRVADRVANAALWSPEVSDSIGLLEKTLTDAAAAEPEGIPRLQ